MKNRIKHILERRAVSITMNAVMFMTSYFLVSFFWRKSVPDLTGLGRLTLCLVAASCLTWMMTSMAKGGGVRLALTILMLGLLAYIIIFQQST
jgi:hypothetical protein